MDGQQCQMMSSSITGQWSHHEMHLEPENSKGQIYKQLKIIVKP